MEFNLLPDKDTPLWLKVVWYVGYVLAGISIAHTIHRRCKEGLLLVKSCAAPGLHPVIARTPASSVAEN
jgi:hypothetical protein